MNYSYPAEDFLLVGKIAKAHGMRGEVKIFPFSGQPENIAKYRELVLVGTRGELSPPLAVLSCRTQGKMVIATLDSISSRDEAEHVEGMGVLLARKDLPKLAENEFYWHQYIGKKVRDMKKETIGEIITVFSNGMQDIMVIDSGSREILVPISKNIVVKETGDEIIIDPPPGLLELYTGGGERDEQNPG
ncbi:MAG: 16S rRNA processing protein RimM [Deltaproteobacteria bacterium]|nr:16S rRNA processing protein RimM [Deltaproteobacteria bacterium]MBW2659228.1 16S rRNA processing protein RimM [Deltaproteobacteria bacterium]